MMNNNQGENAIKGSQVLRNILIALVVLCLLLALGGLAYFYFTKVRGGEEVGGDSGVLLEKEVKQITEVSIKSEWLSCLSDNDCIAVSKKCCKCSEMIDYVFLNKKFEQQFYTAFDCSIDECGGGKCLTTKQYCNEGRCEGEKYCVGNGESFFKYQKIGRTNVECCPGLERTISGLSGAAYCVKCGDGNCVPPETYITCPSDCKIGAEGPEYNNVSLSISFKTFDNWSVQEREDGFDLVSENEKVEFYKYQNDKSWIPISAEVVDKRVLKLDGIDAKSLVYRNVLSDGSLIFFNHIVIQEKNLEVRSVNSVAGFDKVANFLLELQLEIKFVDQYKTSEWDKFSDPVLGISFFYPVEWGDVVINQIDMFEIPSSCDSSGKMYAIGFSFFDELSMLAYSSDLTTCPEDGPSSYLTYLKMKEKGQELKGRFENCSNLFGEQELLSFDNLDMFKCKDVLIDGLNLPSYYQLINALGGVFDNFEFSKIIPLTLKDNESYNFLDIVYSFNDLKIPSNEEVFEISSKTSDAEFVLNRNEEYRNKADKSRGILENEEGDKVLDLKIGLFDKFVELFKISTQVEKKEDFEAGGDFDGDGLSNEEELRLGTNPEVADTDGDGYTDGDEVQKGYNPLGE